MNCNVPTDIVFSFTGFATRGGSTDSHKDGWGIAFFEDAGVRIFVDREAAATSPLAELIRRVPIKSKNVIAHIRKATQGQVALENCHPFVRELWGRYWVFAHNGDLKNFSPLLNGPYRPVGTTDSEKSFCYLLQEMRRRFGDHMPDTETLAAMLESLTEHIAAFGPFNMMLSDGRTLFARCSTNLYYLLRHYPFTMAELADEDVCVDFSELTTPNDRVAIIATEPLTANEAWHPFAPGEFRAFIDGVSLNLTPLPNRPSHQ